jgi:predicted RNA-binding Zn ribbon-like protein
MEPLVGEPLALDLVNTRVGAGDEEVDLLATPDGVRRWLALEADRLPSPPGDVDAAALRTLREHVTAAVEQVRQGSAPPAGALRALGDALRAAPRHRELAWDGAAVVAVARRSGDPTRDVLAELAEAAADLLTDPAVTAVRQCEGPGCRMLFLPAHPRRRWCSAQLCGNRVRVARYYRRHRETGARS